MYRGDRGRWVCRRRRRRRRRIRKEGVGRGRGRRVRGTRRKDRDVGIRAEPLFKGHEASAS
jgi:hypothetical protein